MNRTVTCRAVSLSPTSDKPTTDSYRQKKMKPKQKIKHTHTHTHTVRKSRPLATTLPDTESVAVQDEPSIFMVSEYFDSFLSIARNLS